MNGCPNCGCEEIEIYDECLDSEIDLENNKIYVKQSVSCPACGHKYGRTVIGDIVYTEIKNW